MTDSEKQARLEEAKHLVATVNEAERDDNEVNWRPWAITRQPEALA